MTPTSPPPPRVDVLGIPVDALSLPQLLERVEAFLEEAGPPPGRSRRTISYVNVHVLDQAGRHPELADFLRSVDLCYCDGKGVVLAARLLGGHLPERMTGADWIWELAARAEGRWRIAWLGGEPGVTAEAARRLQERHPRLEVLPEHGFHPKTGPENDALVQRINGWRPHVLLVGMGTPLQERWVAANREALEVPVVWCLGATADFVSGRVPRGPEWLYRRQEWLARLLVDPKRLWRRYLLGNSRVLARVLAARARRELGRLRP